MSFLVVPIVRKKFPYSSSWNAYLAVTVLKGQRRTVLRSWRDRMIFVHLHFWNETKSIVYISFSSLYTIKHNTFIHNIR
jgi:hypothetical protein